MLAACGTQHDATRDAAVQCTPAVNPSAPTYTQLYQQYFAAGTPGHCATAMCHANPGDTVWLCGTSPSSCYAGMVQAGLIDPVHPMTSLIANPNQSPLVWINQFGNMPYDAPTPYPPGRDAILAWIAVCAPDN